MVMIVVVPIVFRVPAMRIFIPPAMAMIPTVLTRIREFTAIVIRLGAIPTVFRCGLV